MIKKCCRCKKIQDIENFFAHKFTKDKKDCYCKDCRRELGRKYSNNSPKRKLRGQQEEVKQYQKNYYYANKEKIAEVSRRYAKLHATKLRQYQKQWREENRERHLAKKKEYQQKTKDRFRPLRRKSERERMKNSPIYRLNKYFGHQMRLALQSGKNGRSWESLVGYSVSQLKTHLEKQFKPGMSWDNYGPYWHIDHKIPIAAFNFKTAEDIDFKRCWSLKNLQPLEAEKNLSKNAKLDQPFQPAFVGL